jgi:D-Tyr-tRNAtyr deacylase
MPSLIQRIIEALVSKKKVVGWVAAALIPIIGVAIGMQSDEVKSAICESK